MGPTLVFTDLDDTGFSTARKQASLGECTVASLTEAGEPSGWQNPRQAALWLWLQAMGELVPVTARTRASLARVLLPFSRHAIWCHGASIRVDGIEDHAWHDRSASTFATMHDVWPKIQAIMAQLPAFSQARFGRGYDPDFGVTQLDIAYPGIGQQADLLRQVAQDICGDAAWLHVQTDRLCLLPRGISKVAAVKHVIEVLNPSMTVGAGDSLSDIPFIALCDVCVMPTQSFAFRHFHQSIQDAT